MSRALVFDFDGLIVDTEWPEYECWRRVFEAHGLPLSIADYIGTVGIGSAQYTDMWLVLEGRLGRPVQDRRSWQERRLAHHQELSQSLSLLPGVAELFELGRSRGWSIGVASNSSTGWVEKGLARFGLRGHVSALRCKDTASRPKPDPAPYVEVCADLGAAPEASFAFEDSGPGSRAARAAGLTVVVVPNALTKHHDLSAAHHLFESLAQFTLPD